MKCPVVTFRPCCAAGYWASRKIWRTCYFRMKIFRFGSLCRASRLDRIAIASCARLLLSDPVPLGAERQKKLPTRQLSQMHRGAFCQFPFRLIYYGNIHVLCKHKGGRGRVKNWQFYLVKSWQTGGEGGQKTPKHAYVIHGCSLSIKHQVISRLQCENCLALKPNWYDHFFAWN